MGKRRNQYWKGGLQPGPSLAETQDHIPEIITKLSQSMSSISVDTSKLLEQFAQYTRVMSDRRKKADRELFELKVALVVALGWVHVIENGESYWRHLSGMVVANEGDVLPFTVTVSNVARVMRFMSGCPGFLLSLDATSFRVAWLGNMLFVPICLQHKASEWKVVIYKPSLTDLLGALVGWIAADTDCTKRLTNEEPTWKYRVPYYCEGIFDPSTGFAPNLFDMKCSCGSDASLFTCTCIKLSQFNSQETT